MSNTIYKTPSFSWTRPWNSSNTGIITVGGSGALGTESGFDTPKVLNLSTDADFALTPYSSGQDLPLFPYLAWALQGFLRRETSASLNWTVRWVWDSADTYLATGFNTSRAHDPKLLITVGNAASTTGTVTLTFGGTNPLPRLNSTYTTIDNNWAGLVGGSTNVLTLNAASHQGTGVYKSVTTDTSPWGVWNPVVLQWGDERSLRTTIGQTNNTYTDTKTITLWGERYSRILTLPVVCAKNVYAYRRIDPLFEEDSLRRLSPNNTYEALTRSARTNRVHYVWSKMGNPNALPTVSIVDWMAQFEGRTCRILDSAIVADDTRAWTFHAQDQKLYNLAIEMSDVNLNLPLVTRGA